jgi:ribonuclease-3
MLEKKLGYKFKDPKLLNIALRHRSVGKNSNERMEFLGDAIVNFVIAAELYYKYPQLREGELSRLRSHLVRKETLADLAREFAVGKHLFLGAGEKKSGGFRRASILADAMEAIIGAIYLDSNIDICRQKVLQWYAQRLTDLEITATKDAKTELQELLQGQGLPLPTYKVVATKGKMHAKVFYVECNVAGLEIVTQGQGRSKQAAEQESAKEFLARMQSL